MTSPQKLRGVNLGGWLVLEKWITPALFAGTDANDEYHLMQTKGAVRKINKHRKTFITEDDFKWMTAHGVNAIRIPVGYWVFDGDSPYTPAVKYLDWAIDMAERYDIKVLIDLHGAKGSQNGHNHSGQIGRARWHRSRQFRQQTIDVLQEIGERYYSRECVWGIELLNEPKPGLFQFTLRRFYRQAYKRLLDVIRPDVYVVFSDAFMPWLFSGALLSRTSNPVAMDVHWYQFAYQSTLKRCFRMIRRRIRLLVRWQRRQPVIIGEWSAVLSTKILSGHSDKERRRMVQDHAHVQLQAYQQADGWFYWTYKTDGPGPWNFKSMIDDGVFSLD
ncbi:MAG: cellulase family glycosylhydrolase [Candidatus Saccharimonadales bacterium]